MLFGLANESANVLFVVERVVIRIMFLCVTYLVCRRVIAVFIFCITSRSEFVVSVCFLMLSKT